MVTDDQRKMLEDMYAPEDLHPDLVPFLNTASFGTMIRHPLVYSVPHHEVMNRQINRLYLSKLMVRDEARENENWSQFIFVYERPYRLNALMEIFEEIDDNLFWNLVGTIWTDSENVHQNFDEWSELWTSTRPGRLNVMDADDQATLQALPEIVTIYRGYGHEDALNGFSWTLNKSRGEWFARRYSSMDGHKPHLAIGTVRKEDILAYFSGRNEEEIVVDPENVVVSKVLILKAKKRNEK